MVLAVDAAETTEVMHMDVKVKLQIDELQSLSTKRLQEKFCELFGYETRSNHRQYLFRRIAWRLQALAEGDLSERARRRALEIANDADLRTRAPKQFLDSAPERESRTRVTPADDDRLPLPGTLLTRSYQGETIVVKVLDGGFEHGGEVYRSLSAVARHVTGTNWNGYAFFNVKRSARRARA